jgi:hypothetical protein
LEPCASNAASVAVSKNESCWSWSATWDWVLTRIAVFSIIVRVAEPSLKSLSGESSDCMEAICNPTAVSTGM